MCYTLQYLIRVILYNNIIQILIYFTSIAHNIWRNWYVSNNILYVFRRGKCEWLKYAQVETGGLWVYHFGHINVHKHIHNTLYTELWSIVNRQLISGKFEIWQLNAIKIFAFLSPFFQTRRGRMATCASRPGMRWVNEPSSSSSRGSEKDVSALKKARVSTDKGVVKAVLCVSWVCRFLVREEPL